MPKKNIQSQKQKRLNTKLESEGAEFLVLGHLLIEGISCYKAYVNYPGYDLLAVNPDKTRTAKIQVKSRWATDYNRSFPMKNFQCDFVVHVALNRGYRYRKKKKGPDAGIDDPVYFIFPVVVVKKAQVKGDQWGLVRMSGIPNIAKYKNNWGLIAKFLRLDSLK